LETALGEKTPDYLNKIICGDCREIFPEIRREHPIDLILSDIPYNIGFSRYDKYSDNLPESEFIHMLAMFQDGRTPLAFIAYPEVMANLVNLALGTPAKSMAWVYSHNCPRQHRQINVYNEIPDFNKVRQPYKKSSIPKAKKKGLDIENGARSYDWMEIQQINNVSKEKFGHPCQTPVEVMRRCILFLTEPGDTVYDPFGGVGSTAIACLETGRNYICTELSPEYCKKAEERIQGWHERNDHSDSDAKAA